VVVGADDDPGGLSKAEFSDTDSLDLQRQRGLAAEAFQDSFEQSAARTVVLVLLSQIQHWLSQSANSMAIRR